MRDNGNEHGQPEWATWKLAALVFGVVLLYTAELTPRWQMWPDSALYLMLGENLAAGEGYTLFGDPHAFVPPGFPLVIAALIRIGLGEMLWLNLAMILMALAAIGFGYCLLREVVPAPLAVGITLLTATSTMMFRFAVGQLTDIPFALLVCGGLWCCQRGLRSGSAWLALGVVGLLLSCWVRVVGLPLATAAAVGLLLEARPRSRPVWVAASALAVGVALSGGVFYSWNVAVQASAPQETYALEAHRFGLSDRSIVDWAWQPVANLTETGPELCRLLTAQTMPAPVALVVIWGPTLIGMGLLWARRRYLILAVIVGTIAPVLLVRPFYARHLLPLAPLLILCFVEGLRRLVELRPRWRVAAPRLVAGCLAVLVVMNVVKNFKTIGRVHGSANDLHRRLLTETAGVLRDRAQDGDRFVGAPKTSLSYLSGGVPYADLYGLFVYRRPAAEEVFRVLQEQNVRLVVVQRGPRPYVKPYEEVLEAAVAGAPDFELVFENEQYDVYQRNPSLPRR